MIAAALMASVGEPGWRQFFEAGNLAAGALESLGASEATASAGRLAARATVPAGY